MRLSNQLIERRRLRPPILPSFIRKPDEVESIRTSIRGGIDERSAVGKTPLRERRENRLRMVCLMMFDPTGSGV